MTNNNGGNNGNSIWTQRRVTVSGDLRAEFSLDDWLVDYYDACYSDEAIARLINDALPEVETTASAVRSRATRLGLKRAGPSLFTAEITSSRHFEVYDIPTAPNGSRVVFINDFQIPFHDRRTVKAIQDFLIDFEPNTIILPGDIIDFYEMSDFDKDPSRRFSLQTELDIAQRLLRLWTRQFPNAEKVFIQGNHEDRLRRRIWKHPEWSSLRDLNLAQLLRIEDSWRVLDYGSQVNYLGFLVEHGEVVRAQAGATARAMFERRGSSGMCGHTHRFGIYSRRNAKGGHSYIENGCVCRLDPEYVPNPDWQQAFTYGFAQHNEVHLMPTQIYYNGFRAEGKFYKRAD